VILPLLTRAARRADLRDAIVPAVLTSVDECVLKYVVLAVPTIFGLGIGSIKANKLLA
jgi:hypothetical protein